MKKLWTAGLCGVALILGATACRNSEKNNKENGEEPVRQEVTRNLKFVSYSYDMIGEQIGGATLDVPGSRYVEYTGEGILPEALGDDNIQMLRDSLQRLAGVEFADDDRPSPVTDADHRLTDLSPSTTQSCGEVSSRMSASLVNPRVVAFEHVAGTYECLAAHGMTTTTCVNYCMDHGKILELSDLVRPEMKDKLTALLRQSIKDLNIPLNVELNTIDLPQEFAVASDGLEFIFQPYDIAPFSEGTVRVPVSLGALMEGNMLTEEGDFIFNGVR